MLKIKLAYKRIERKIERKFSELTFVDLFPIIRVTETLKLREEEYIDLLNLCRKNGIEILSGWSPDKKKYIFGFKTVH